MYASSKQIKKKPNTGSNEFNPTQSQIQHTSTINKQQDYKFIPTFDLPFILTQAINDPNQINKYQQELQGSLSSLDGTCFIIHSNELFIWTIDKPQYCDRIELSENITRQHIVVYKNRSSSDRFSVFICSPSTGYIRFWGNSSKQNISQDLLLETPPSNNTPFKVFIAECQPFGVIVGNSIGSIYLVSVKNNNNLISKKINKSQGMLSYLYLSRQSPVVSVFSSPSQQLQQLQSQPSIFSTGNQYSSSSSSATSVKSRDIYILTEGSLLKYEIMNGSERVVLDYPIYKEIGSHFQTTPKFHQMVIDTIQDQNKDEIQLVNLILYEASASQNLAKYYLLQIEVEDDTVSKIKRIDRFNSTKKLTGGGVVSIEPVLNTNSLKYYLTWFDSIYYYSSSNNISGSITFPSSNIAFSGFYKNQFYFFSDGGISKLDIQPFGSGAFASSEFHIQDTINKSLATTDSDNMMVDRDTVGTTISTNLEPILFDIPKEDNGLIGSKRNNVLKLMNSYSLKQHSKVEQLVKLIKNTGELDQVMPQVSLWIIDQQPNSKYWADDGKTLHIFSKEISVQLNQQLEDKKKRHSFFFTCLKDTELDKLLSPITKEFLKKNEIKIKTAIELRNFQNKQEEQLQHQRIKNEKQQHFIDNSGNANNVVVTSSMFPQLIESLVKERNPNWTNIGMNVYELFYSNVSGIDQILLNIIRKLQENQYGGNQQYKVVSTIVKAQNLIEGCELFYLIASCFPVEYLNSSIIKVHSGSGITIHGLFSDIIDLVQQFIQSEFQSSTYTATNLIFKKELGISNIDKLIYAHLYKLTELYLYSLKINQFDQFNQLKTKLIESFIIFNSDQAIKLANQFDDYYTYIDVYCSKKSSDNDIDGDKDDSLLVTCLSKFQKIGMLTKVYEYMLEKGLRSEILELPEEFNDSLYKFLTSPNISNSNGCGDLSWLHSIKMKNWSNTSNILYQKSISNTSPIESINEKKKLLSLSKVSLLVSGSGPGSILQPSQKLQLDAINQSLSLIKSQKYFLPNIEQVLSASEVIQLILKSHDVGSYIDNEDNEEKLSIFIACIEIISESPLLLKKEETRELLKLILELSLLNEVVFFQPQPTDTQLTYSLKSTLFFKLISHPRFPKDIAALLLNPVIEDYFKLHAANKSRFNTPDDKRQFEICIARLLELSKIEINNKLN